MPQAMMNVPMRPQTHRSLPANTSAESTAGQKLSQGPLDAWADTIAALKATSATVEQLLVSNELLLAESTAAAAVEKYTKALVEFSADAATYPTAKLSAALLPFWRLVTLLVQVRLSMPQPTTPAPSETGESPRTPQQTPREELPVFLPRLFERLEAVRPGTVPPATRLLQAQVLRVLGMAAVGAQYLEAQVLPFALATDYSGQDGDEQKPAKTNGSAGHRDAILAASPHLNHYNGAETAYARKLCGVDCNGGSHSANGNASPTTSSRAARLFRWTPSLLLAAVDLFVDLRFEAAVIGNGQASQSPMKSETPIKRLQDAEVRCIDFVTANSLALSSRLRSCVPSETGHSVTDELLLRIQSSHTKALQVWNREQQQHVLAGQKPSNGAPRVPESAAQSPLAPTAVSPSAAAKPTRDALQTNGASEPVAPSPSVSRPFVARLQRLLGGLNSWWKGQSTSGRLLAVVMPLLAILMAVVGNRLRQRWRSSALSAPPQRRQLTF